MGETRTQQHPRGYSGSLSLQGKYAAPLYVPLCEECHGQMRLSDSLPG